MPRENLRSLTPISQQLAVDTLRIDVVLDSFVVPPAKAFVVGAASGEVPVPNQPPAEAKPCQVNADRKQQNVARRTRRG